MYIIQEMGSYKVEIGGREMKDCARYFFFFIIIAQSQHTTSSPSNKQHSIEFSFIIVVSK